MNFEKFTELIGFQNNAGFPIEQIRNKERKLNTRFPAILINLYLIFGKHPILNSDNSLIPIERLTIEIDGWLAFYMEGQGVCYWAVNTKDFTKSVCPVYCFYDELPLREDDSIEQFLMKFVFHNRQHFYPYSLSIYNLPRVEFKRIVEKYGKYKSSMLLPFDHLKECHYYSDYEVLITISKNIDSCYFWACSKNPIDENKMMKHLDVKITLVKTVKKWSSRYSKYFKYVTGNSQIDNFENTCLLELNKNVEGFDDLPF